MSKNKYIYLLGVLFLIISIVKYILFPAVLPPEYFTFEMLGLFSVLGLIFYVARAYLPKSMCVSEELETQNENLIKDNTRLKERILELEAEEDESLSKQSNKQQLLASLDSIWLNKAEAEDLGKELFNLIKQQFELVAGIIYKKSDNGSFTLSHQYGLDKDWVVGEVNVGEGIHGQSIKEGKASEITDVPEDYLEASSGTGSAKPGYIYILPLLDVDNESLLIEIASFKELGLHLIWNEFLVSKNKMD